MNNIHLIEHAAAMGGRVLDLPPHYLARLADALAVAPTREVLVGAARLRLIEAEAEHYQLTPGDRRGIR